MRHNIACPVFWDTVYNVHVLQSYYGHVEILREHLLCCLRISQKVPLLAGICSSSHRQTALLLTSAHSLNSMALLQSLFTWHESPITPSKTRSQFDAWFEFGQIDHSIAYRNLFYNNNSNNNVGSRWGPVLGSNKEQCYRRTNVAPTHNQRWLRYCSARGLKFCIV